MKSDLISIIIPVYNVEKYLNKCIESVVKQTFKNLEIILIDDGSTDSSGNICDEWKMKDERIIVIHKENGGVSSARNAGLDIAQGEYVGFVDSDDYIDNQMYEVLLKQTQKFNTELSFCNFFDVDEKGKKESSNMEYKCILTKKEVMSGMFQNNNENFALWNKLVKREKLKNIKFDENIKIYEDALFCFQMIENVNSISFCKNNLYFYTDREGSTLMEENIKSKVTTLIAMEKINKILEKNDIQERFQQQCDYIGRVYLYEEISKNQNNNINFSTYKDIAKKYLRDGLLKEKIGLKNKVKVILAVYFTKLYLMIK